MVVELLVISLHMQVETITHLMMGRMDFKLTKDFIAV
jgi:hypothetical protein